MLHPSPIQQLIDEAIAITAERSPFETDGLWLEDITAQVGPLIKEWDISACYLWGDWPDREKHFPGVTRQDIGIDAVAIRRSDGEHIAIQCKARKLDESGRGDPIPKGEIDKFANPSAADFWAERWLVTNGDNPIGDNASKALLIHPKPIKPINIATDLLQQQTTFIPEDCPHCEPHPEGQEVQQTRSCMQEKAVAQSVQILREHEQSDSGGLPIGQARGKIILPCGTGKTRISLRIVEKLTSPGELSIVLSPSIALVAQLRREYLQHSETEIRALAVCSDVTAGYDPKKEGSRNATLDPTVDNSNVSAAEVKGKVTTEPAEIAGWIRDGQETSKVSVIFGTYQSGHRIAEALQDTGVTAKVLICDEAHRTAGLKRKQTKKAGLTEEESRLRNFTLCHDQDEFPATYRVYQTATPRIYDSSRMNQNKASDWIVRTMDDETVFGVELYRKSYMEAVNNGWLSDYRIIAMGVNDPDAFAQANFLAANTKSKGKQSLTAAHYLRGLAFALSMGGATQNAEGGTIPINSCIAFMNTVDKSKNMAEDLQTENVKQWVQKWLHNNAGNQKVKNYTMEHLDATSNVTARDNAKRRLAQANEEHPHSVVNVGIFGEGTDSPSLNAVAFLESRKSPIDVIQAVGRAMRTAPGKDIGYIICPILIPPNADPERWLSTSNMNEGWQELGQILNALRAHDQRIEDNLSDLLQLYIPEPPEVEVTIVAVAAGDEKRISYREHEGPPGEAQESVERVLEGKSTLTKEFRPITETYSKYTTRPEREDPSTPTQQPSLIDQAGENEEMLADKASHSGEAMRTSAKTAEPTQIITGKKNEDGSIELRTDTVARTQPKLDGTPGEIDIEKSKKKAKEMINKGKGIRLTPSERRENQRRLRRERAERSGMQMLLLSGLQEYGDAIRMNLLSKSGLTDNRTIRDLNILESSVKEAAHHLENDNLGPALDRHFGLDNLDGEKRKSQADGCTIAALLLMNAAMLHQRIANGRWLSGVSDLDTLKNDVNVIRNLSREWERIMRHDFRPILEPALEAIYSMEASGRTSGLERALHHITAEAERIAETYADMGADHAGPLFNRVMGNQASDGAFFTRPVAASIAARLTLDACGDVDWTNPDVWREHKTVDLACGSGTLLAAMLTDMKRRAREHGANEAQLADLQKLAVEDTIKGLDINPISLQLAASQLTAGNREIRYRNIGLELMPYGPNQDDPGRVYVGTLELLGQSAIVPKHSQMDLGNDKIASQTIWNQHDYAELENAVDAVKEARIVIMNPPFTNRAKMGEKFSEGVQQALRQRTDILEDSLVKVDPELKNFGSRNTVRPCFVMLADRLLPEDTGTLTMINPTIALSAPSGLNERRILAERYHIHTVLTGRWPREFTLSQNVEVDECMVIAMRHNGVRPPTRFVHLDRMPSDEDEVAELHQALRDAPTGLLADGWGEVSEWPAERMAEGDWTPAIWRSRELAEAARRYAGSSTMLTIGEHGYNCWKTSAFGKDRFIRALSGTSGSFPMIGSKGADGQITICSAPDSEWLPTKQDESQRIANGGTYAEVDKFLEKAGNLLVTAGQAPSTARLTAIASDEKYVGRAFLPITGPTAPEAKAIAVFVNSTTGRLQLLRNAGRKLAFPIYNPAVLENIRIPNVKDDRILQILADCWERTKDMEVPQFREGECEVRRLWDEAVAEAMEWDPDELARLRHLLHQEPHVRGLGYGQFGDEVNIEPADRERFQELADQWEIETVFLSNSDRAAEHLAHQEIVSMGEKAVSLILERMQSQGGHWFHALRDITNANPVQPSDRGNIEAMQTAWLDWGELNGYV